MPNNKPRNTTPAKGTFYFTEHCNQSNPLLHTCFFSRKQKQNTHSKRCPETKQWRKRRNTNKTTSIKNKIKISFMKTWRLGPELGMRNRFESRFVEGFKGTTHTLISPRYLEVGVRSQLKTPILTTCTHLPALNRFLLGNIAKIRHNGGFCSKHCILNAVISLPIACRN